MRSQQTGRKLLTPLLLWESDTYLGLVLILLDCFLFYWNQEAWRDTMVRWRVRRRGEKRKEMAAGHLGKKEYV